MTAAAGRRGRLLEALEDATRFYERYLWDSPAGSFARDYLAGRGLAEPVCREFRLGLALGGSTLARKALEKGYTAEELRAAGLTGSRGGDYFQRRLLFPLTDPRGRVLGFQARRLHEDDPLRAKYVNTADSELFTKGAVVYGLDRSRAAIAREDRACIVEGNTDVLALRQAGFQPVVACMGTALTEQQLRELRRLTTRLWLAFDGDAAGESATLRGMALAAAQGFDVKVVALPPGIDPADDPGGFEAKLATGAPVRPLPHPGGGAPRGGPRGRPADRDGVPQRRTGVAQPAGRLAMGNDYFGMPIQIRGGGTASGAIQPSPRLARAGDRLERGALAGVIAYPNLRPVLAEISPDHFWDETSRELHAHLVAGTQPGGRALALLAELDAWGPGEGIDEPTAKEYLLRLRERTLWAELQQADLARTKELREALARIQEAVAALGEGGATAN